MYNHSCVFFENLFKLHITNIMNIYQNVNKLTSLGHFYFLYFLEFSKFSAVNIYYFCDLKAIKIKINFEFIGKWKTD